jgi:gamma-tubulin complex component 3
MCAPQDRNVVPSLRPAVAAVGLAAIVGGSTTYANDGVGDQHRHNRRDVTTHGAIVAVPAAGGATANTTTAAAAAATTAFATNTADEVDERALLRDCLYVFQGIDGRHVRFDDNSRDGVVVDAAAGVSAPQRTLLKRVCDLGWMYRRVRDAIAASRASPGAGLVEQALMAALHAELTDYYRLIAVLESQLTAAATAGGTHVFTLRRVYVWAQDPLERMQLMATLCESARGLRGGALATAIAAHRHHGDPVLSSFVHRILRSMCRPLTAMVEAWVSTGDLNE